MTSKPDPNRLMTVAEAAQLLHQSQRTVKRRIAEGELAAFKLGRHWRIARNELESYLMRHQRGTKRGFL